MAAIRFEFSEFGPNIKSEVTVKRTGVITSKENLEVSHYDATLFALHC